MDDTDLPLSKGTTSVLSNATVIARRKRMEIRRFKKLSGATHLLHDKINPVAENSASCIKRARIERATTTGSFSLNIEGNGTLSFSLQTEEAHSHPLSEGQDSAKLHDRGLIRYKSLPPKNWPYIYVSGEALPYFPDTDILIGTCSMKEGQLEKSRDQEGKSSLAFLEAPFRNSAQHVKRMGEGLRAKPDIIFPAEVSVSSSHEISQNAAVTSDPVVDKSDAEMVDVPNQPSGNTLPQVMSTTHSTRASSCQSPNESSCPPSGKLLVCGRRREMEDTATIVPSFTQLDHGTLESCFCTRKVEDKPCDLHFFAVYDGHGGSQASKFCMERLHHALAEELSTLSLASEGNIEPSEGLPVPFAWEKAMASCFSKVDREVGGVCPNGQCTDVGSGGAPCCEDSIAPENVGTTAIVAVVSSCQIVVANCGDSRAVLSRGGQAIPLSRDHKPEREDETSRIEAAGGRVIYWDGYRVGGLLALSRSIGDRYLKQYVVSDPEVRCLPRTEEDECLILASDGLWDVISNETACEIARKCLRSSRKKRASGSLSLGEDPASAAVAALLVKLAYGRGSKDNISVVVIDLKS